MSTASSPPHATILAAVVIAERLVSSMIGGNAEAIAEYISELLSPIGLQFLPIILLFTIQFLSSDSGSFVLSSEPNSIHLASGSPVVVALLRLLTSFFTKQEKTEQQQISFEFTHSVDINMSDDQHRGPPHAALLAALLIVGMMVPSLTGENGNAITEFISELLTPIGLHLLPIILLLTVQFLSSNTASFVSTGEPNSIHRVSGSPVGVALVLLLVLSLRYNPFSIFGDGGGGGD